MGCERVAIEYLVEIDQTPVYHINITGAFDEAATISKADLLSAVDIPKDATIEEIEIESFAVRAIEKEGNQAKELLVTAITYDSKTDKLKMFEDYTVSIQKKESNLLSLALLKFVGIQTLLNEGVSSLKGKIKQIVKEGRTEPFVIAISGDSKPPGQKILLDLELQIKMTVKYKVCEDVPFGLFDNNKKCSGEPTL